ncbi:hypothetical protein B296_00038892 [Ensete ventricosum]|uniref:Uncharacterized protein n=1 Tax=Ensete ventricosum TaxID=4639 RepID=A0A426ZV31_ENSVE|nr:hypothetical protein B296_00038892 [Ensete ventricosum]
MPTSQKRRRDMFLTDFGFRIRIWTIRILESAYFIREDYELRSHPYAFDIVEQKKDAKSNGSNQREE